MTHDKIRNQLEQIAGDIDGEVYEGYSGRGMYGDQCWGITCTDSIKCIEAAAADGIFGAKTDSMGCDQIVYWPKLKYTKEL